MIGEEWDEREEQETDYGRLWYATPSRVYEPTSIAELANLLRELNRNSVPVTIRNTGHSMNGQTVTDGVQVRIGNIRGITFHEEQQQVEAHCGDSWDSILKAIRFPEWCPPVFPNNPGQRIHMGGTIAAGGIGAYSASRGGFWNHVIGITLVTMEGEIIECSRTENPQLFLYSLGGWGRIGVIVKFRVRVECSKKGLVAGGIFFGDAHAFFSTYEQLATHPDIDLLSCQVQVSNHGLLDMPWAAPYRIGFGCEAQSDKEAQEKIDRIKQAMPHTLHFFGHVDDRMSVSFSMKPTLNPKRYAVYVFPEEEPGTGERTHIWHDYIVKKDEFVNFVEDARQMIINERLHDSLLKQPFFHGLLHVDMFGGYLFKHFETALPLVPEVRSGAHSWHINLSQNVAREDVKKSLELANILTQRCYECGGKRYLYGTHTLTKEQVYLQYGHETIQKWNDIKHSTDPKALLNRGVIPHLDEML